MNIDIAAKHPDPEARRAADDLVALMTPIVKAYFTDHGFDATNMGMQLYGGHGYIREYGMEQFVRDARIAQIYEGANAIQALDLVGRKLPQDMGRLLRQFFHPVSELLEETQEDPELLEFAIPLAKAFGKLQQATAIVAQKGMKNPDEAGAASTDYLRLFALVALGYMWLRMVKVARERLTEVDGAANGAAGFYDSKIKTARFFMTKSLPQVNALFLSIMAGSRVLMEMDADAF
jgi:hypothetical protein